MLPSSSFESVLRREIESLPLLPEAEWVPVSARTTIASHAIWAVSGAALIAAAVVGGNALREWRQQTEAGSTAAAPAATSPVSTSAASQNAASTPVPTQAAPTPSVSSVGAPQCPADQVAVLDATYPAPPGDQPGTGSASAEAAFRKRYPSATDFTMYAWGSDRPTRSADELGRGPVWIVARAETFVAQIIGTPGGNNWFVYPAKFVGCRVP